MHSSPSLDEEALCVTLHPRRRQVVFGGMEREGSSDSDSGGAGEGEGGGLGGARARETISGEPFGAVDMGFGGGGAVPGSCFEGAGAVAGVSSTVECLPVVHGGIERNSSKVRTRGLQHFQPRDDRNIVSNK